jgi:hypothetical protein
MDMMVRGLNILVQDWSASFRYYFPGLTVKIKPYYLLNLKVVSIHVKGTNASTYYK